MALGKVYLVGAGPGSADLLTVRALRAIRKTDVLICDSLLPNTFLEEADVNTAERKIEWLEDEKGRKNQEQINQLMLKYARAGKNVARVKVGDPLVFGRGREEQSFLEAHGIESELISGLSVCTAAPAAADITITERKVSSSFAVVTARCAGGKINDSFPKADTLIIFMAMDVIDEVVVKLLADGWDKQTSVNVVERASMPWQRQVFGKLGDIANLVKEQNVQAPVVLVVGAAAATKDELINKRARVLFTGTDPSNFRTMGTILHWPAIQIERNDEGYKQLPQIINNLKEGKFGYVIFASKVSARLFFEALSRMEMDTRVFAGAKVIAAGRGTAETLVEKGIRADITSRDIGSRGIMTEADQLPPADVLIVQSATATEKLASDLARKLGKAKRLSLHYVVPNPDLGRKLPEHDVIYFTSPSGVRACWEAYGKAAFEQNIWCIGDVTLAQLRELGFKAKVVVPYVS